MRWACIVFPHFAIDGVLRQRPASARPLALLTGPAHKRTVHAVNDEAAARGLKPGQSVQAAQALAADGEWLEFDAAALTRDRHLLAAWAYAFSSHVSLVFEDAVVLEVGQSLSLFGPWPAFERRLRQELTDLGFRHRLVAAPNAWAARTLANVHDGVAIDAPQLSAALGRVPVEAAGFDPDVAHAFTRMGLRRLAQVVALPRDAVARRFPPQVLAWVDALRGRTVPLPLYQPPTVFDRRFEFDHEIELSSGLVFPLRRLIGDLAAFVRARDGGVQRFRVVFEHDRHAPTQLDVGLLAPERDAVRLLDVARHRLERIAVNGPVRAVRLVANDLPPFVPPSGDLFEQHAPGALTFDQLRERLRARLGDTQVHGLATDFDHRPERAWRTQRGRNEPLAALGEARPGWLLEQPVPLRARVRVLVGPERVESGWWDGDDVRRDYYIVEADDGQVMWVYAAPGERGPFMLHGYFA
ncbi:MAG: DNA repair nucleotidyltransferase [Lysobacterales bacterium 69-70]|nr:DNA polymerase Y family protein [Xanthomonadaceae bacterium]ODU35776.1 MAG: DNA repair nucleotidyltransferase [Xanthomonadaceae bacterium SCN 69-320]ODV17486.1 MAG: DNA repair nucleotidyltransferase [Xanthomonadaceae bacterium SCN 69-25]OJY97264.1 MAG: DNA repair nucleotidyltransferase [Xanthomonadales bacterium 69-70]